MERLSALIFTALSAFAAQAQITVTDNLPAGDIATLLEGLNVTISNVEVNCAGSAMGHFTGTSELDIEEGLLLTSGLATNVAGVASYFANHVQGTPGDADLDMQIAPYPTYDACVLEFDCVPNGDTLLFNFSFGSEEYPEFVGSAFNDVFAIWLTGPGFPYPTNVAALPDGTPVAINNVNAQMNANYFHDNAAPPGQYTAYDGFTTNLTVFAVVEPDADYHFKVAIADAGDAVFDSGVFLEAFSFRSTDLSTHIGTTTAPGFRMLREGDLLTLLLPDDIAPDAEITVTGAAGQLVQRLRANGDRVDLDLSGLGSGLYTVQLHGSGVVQPIRFVME